MTEWEDFYDVIRREKLQRIRERPQIANDVN